MDRVRDGVLLGVLRGLRPCEHAVQVPAVCADDSGCALPSVHRQSWTFLLCSYSANCASDRRVFQVLLVDRFLTCPLLCNATCTVLGCQGRRHLRRGADAISLVLTAQKNIEIFQLQSIEKVVDVTVGQIQQIPRVLSV